nr:DUF4240 domain-containing protein [uncultured Clostridium sp.]
MDKGAFWKLIDEVNLETNRNDKAAILKETERKLMSLPVSELVDWHSILIAYHELAYRYDLWAACVATHSHSTDDGFIDFRSWLIPQGKEIYTNAVNYPDSLADVVFPVGSADFEAYGSVAYAAYDKKMALETEGLSSILLKYHLWLERRGPELSARFLSHPRKDMSTDERLVALFLRTLSKDYDLNATMEKQSLNNEILMDIKSEIHNRPDIAPDWDAADLPRIVPQLYEKYSAEDTLEWSMTDEEASWER